MFSCSPNNQNNLRTSILLSHQIVTHCNSRSEQSVPLCIVLLLCIWEVPDLNIDTKIDYAEASILTYLLTHSMEQSRPWEANRFSASQKIFRIW